jgi:hypothetical protein
MIKGSQQLSKSKFSEKSAARPETMKMYQMHLGSFVIKIKIYLLIMKMTVWDVAPCSLYKITDVSEVLTASIITSETSVNFYQTTRCNIPLDSHLHTHRRENFKCWTCIGELERGTSLVQP